MRMRIVSDGEESAFAGALADESVGQRGRRLKRGATMSGLGAEPIVGGIEFSAGWLSADY